MQNLHIRKVIMIMKTTPPATPPAIAGVEDAFSVSA